MSKISLFLIKYAQLLKFWESGTIQNVDFRILDSNAFFPKAHSLVHFQLP